jgi:putative FmdB family regulatory protein
LCFKEAGDMPIYEYECSACGGHFEVVQKFSDPAPTACKLCNSTRVRKLLSPTAFVLKGSGWYATDYPSADRKKSVESEKPKTEKPKGEPASKAGCSEGTCPSKK